MAGGMSFIDADLRGSVGIAHDRPESTKEFPWRGGRSQGQFEGVPVRNLTSFTLLLLGACGFAACSSGAGGLFDASDGGAGPQASSSPGSDQTPKTASGTDDGDDTRDEPSPRDGGKRDGSSTKDGGSTDAGKTDAGKKDASGGFDASSAPTESCQYAGSCDDGTTLQFCTTTQSGSGCIGARYDLDGTSYECASCGNCSAAADDAQSACHPSVSTPTESCTSLGYSCTVGGTIQYCTTTVSGTGCTAASYKHNGKTYSCSSCSSCDSAWGNAYVACMDAKYGCDDLEVCCGYFPSASQQGCYNSVSSFRSQLGGDVQCKSTYNSYSQAGYCP
jgi:hypothetical protein